MKKRFTKKRVIALILLLVFLATYFPFVSTRFSNYSTYFPCSGRVFDLAPEDGVKQIRLQNGTTGNMVDYFAGEEDFDDLINHLNSFRYLWWVPQIPVAKGGYSYWMAMDINGETVDFEFDRNSILVRGVWFHSGKKWFQNLINRIPAETPE